MRRFHYVLMEIKLERGVVNILDLRRKDPQTYADMTKMLNKQVQSIIIAPYQQLFVHFLISQVIIIIFFVLQGLETVHRRSSGTAEGAAIYISKCDSIAIHSSMPFIMLHYQFD